MRTRALQPFLGDKPTCAYSRDLRRTLVTADAKQKLTLQVLYGVSHIGQ